MFAIRVRSVFSAAHALVINGQREPLHGHDWHVTLTIEGPVLDADELLWDFHAAEQDLTSIVTPFKNQNLNEVAPFSQTNPSAEAVAHHIGVKFAAMLQTRLARYPKSLWADGLRLASVEVTEAPGCSAMWRPTA